MLTQYEKNINGGKYYWKFQSVMNKVLKNEKQCTACGSSNDLQVHHIVQSKVFDNNYTNESNITVLCEKCHKEYHKQYGIVNSKTFIEFVKRKHQSSLQLKLNDVLRELDDVNQENIVLKKKLKSMKQQLMFMI